MALDIGGPLPPEPDAPPLPLQGVGGIQFVDAAPMLCGVVDNGVCPDDPRVMTRTNEAIKIVLDNMIPVGGMATFFVNTFAVGGFFGGPGLQLPPQLENAIEVVPTDLTSKVRNDTDIKQGWYELVNNSVYLDPSQQHDNPLVDYGLFPDANDPKTLRRTYVYPGLTPDNALVQVTGAKRYIPITNNLDYLIVQNIEALKCIILSIERYENNDPDGAAKYRQTGLQLLEAEVKKHLMDPRNYMRRVANYYADIASFPENTFGWMRGNLALDIDMAIKTGKEHLSWALNQVERRIMKTGIYKDTVIQLRANVVGGIVYFPLYVGSVLAVDLDGNPIPVRSQFFQHLDNGPGGFPCSEMLIDQGDELFPQTQTLRRKYKLISDCCNGTCLNAVCKLRWLEKKPGDMMVIKNYEALRLLLTAKFLEEKEDWQNAKVNSDQAFKLMDDELRDYLAGIRHTVHVQTLGFGLGDVGGFWTQ